MCNMENNKFDEINMKKKILFKGLFCYGSSKKNLPIFVKHFSAFKAASQSVASTPTTFALHLPLSHCTHFMASETEHRKQKT